VAIVSLIALLVALAVVAWISLQPFAATSLAPQVSVAPGLGVGLGDAVVVAPGRRLGVSMARPATGVEARFAATAAPAEKRAGGPQLGIGPARAVGGPARIHPPVSSPGPPTEPSPAPPSSPVPVSAPVAVPAPEAMPAQVPDAAPPAPILAGGGSHPSGPTSAGVGSPGEIGPDAVRVEPGDQYVLAFSFYIQPTVYRPAGDENAILRFIGEAGEAATFALQLWDDGSSGRGLWSSGAAMGAERLLAPVAEGGWHRAVLYFRASNAGDGFYLLTLDGRPLDTRAWVDLIDSGSGYAWIEVGLFREGEWAAGAPDVFFDSTQLSATFEAP
jgi:hypothetical protein